MYLCNTLIIRPICAMTFQKKQLLLFILLFSTVFSMAQSHSRLITSHASDSTKVYNFSPNQIALSDSIVNYGKLFLNTPYHYGSPGTSSFDCSGFTSYVYRNFGIDLPRSSVDQSRQFDTVERSNLKVGDLVFFSGRRRSKNVGHVGIVVSAKDNGEFNFIHAAVHSGVTISNSTEAYYTKRFLKASRVLAANPLLSVVHSLFSKKGYGNENTVIKQTPVPAKIAAPNIAQNQVKQTKKIIPAEFHRVKAGETLSTIARKFGMTTAELKKKNHLRGNKLSKKQLLKVKDEETIITTENVQTLSNITKDLADNKSIATAVDNSKPDQDASETKVSAKTHIVAKGETLYGIAKSNGISVENLKKINGISNGKVKPGQELKLIQSSIDSKKNEVAKVETSHTNTSHKVVSGESLYSISKRYNVTIDELKKINNIPDGKIKPGQEILISQITDSKTEAIALEKPEVNNIKSEKTIFHKIKKGESLISIAKDNNMSVDELKRINNLSDTKIRFGQELKLNQVSEKPQSIAATSDKPTESIKHKVKPGESYFTIAKKYGCTVDDLKEWNKKSGSKIKAGEKIIVFAKINK